MEDLGRARSGRRPRPRRPVTRATTAPGPGGTPEDRQVNGGAAGASRVRGCRVAARAGRVTPKGVIRAVAAPVRRGADDTRRLRPAELRDPAAPRDCHRRDGAGTAVAG